MLTVPNVHPGRSRRLVESILDALNAMGIRDISAVRKISAPHPHPVDGDVEAFLVEMHSRSEAYALLIDTQSDDLVVAVAKEVRTMPEGMHEVEKIDYVGDSLFCLCLMTDAENNLGLCLMHNDVPYSFCHFKRQTEAYAV